MPILPKVLAALARPLSLTSAKTRDNPKRRGQLGHAINALRPALAAAAQRVYDKWEQDENGEDCDLGCGGICDSIANSLSEVVGESFPDAEVYDGGQPGDDHAWIVVQRGDEAYAVDIPPSVYETGGGYCWKKRPGVVFDADDVVIEAVRPEPRDNPGDPDIDRLLAFVREAQDETREHMSERYQADPDDDYGIYHEVLTEKLRNRGEYIGSGIGRVAFSLPGDRVLKVALIDSARPMNDSEARIWERASKDDRKILVPVLEADPDGEWLTMPYAEPMPERWRPKPEDRAMAYDLVGRGDVGASENWGRYRGRPRLLDYGQG